MQELIDTSTIDGYMNDMARELSYIHNPTGRYDYTRLLRGHKRSNGAFLELVAVQEADENRCGYRTS